jgi:hypothetical protein
LYIESKLYYDEESTQTNTNVATYFERKTGVVTEHDEGHENND